MSPTSDSNSNPPKPAAKPDRVRAGSDHTTCTAAAVLAFTLYNMTSPITVTGEDAGELVAAAATLGIPHPPGYPLWTMLAWASVHLLPDISAFGRAAMLSSLLASGAVWFNCRLTLDLTRSRPAAVAAGLCLAFSYEFWEQSVIPEVYSLNAFLLSLAFYAAYRWHRSRSSRALYLLAACSGLAAAHYSLSVFFVPLFLGFAMWTDRRPIQLQRYVGPVIVGLSSLLMYLYLPLRSLVDPAMDWGNPETLSRFWDVVSRAQYAHLVDPLPHSLSAMPGRLGVFLGIATKQFTPILVPLLLLGIPAAIKRNKPFGILLILGLVVGCGVPLVIPGFPLEYQWIWLNTPYWIPAYMVGAVLIGVGVAWISDRFPAQPALPIVACVLVVMCPLLWNGRLFFERDQAAILVDIYAFELLEEMEPDAVYFASGDHTTFPVVYLQIVENKRPDVLIANPYGYAHDQLYKLVGEEPPARRPGRVELDRLFARVQKETDRPVYSASRREPSGDRRRVNAGLLYAYLRPDTDVVALPYERFVRWVRPPRTAGDWTLELIHYEYWHAAARMAFDAGDHERGIEALRTAASFLHDSKLGLSALGVTAAEAGELEEAAEYFERALDADPTLVPTRANLARCLRELGRIDEALAVVNTGLERTPDSAPLLAEKERASAAIDTTDAR